VSYLNYKILLAECYKTFPLDTHTHLTDTNSSTSFTIFQDVKHMVMFLDQDPLDTYTLTLFYNTFIIILYMFRGLYAHHQEAELYWCSIWYRHSENKWVV